MKDPVSKLSILFASLSLCASSLSFAEVTHKPVGVPTCGAQYRIGVTGYALRAMKNDLNYASTRAVRDGMQIFRDYLIQHDDDLGFAINGSVLLNMHGTDVSANYHYFSTDADDTATKPEGSSSVIVGIDVIGGTSSKAKSDFTFHEFNVEVGQQVDFCQLHTRCHFGISCVSIEHEVDMTTLLREDGEVVYNSSVTTSNWDSKYTGFGPRVGVDMTYPLSNCYRIALVAHASGSILAGKRERDQSSVRQTYALDEQTGNVVPDSRNVFQSQNDDTYSVVPAGNIKLGMRYGNVIEPGACGWAIEAGWHAATYLHGVHSIGFNPHAFNTAGVYLTLDYAG